MRHLRQANHSFTPSVHLHSAHSPPGQAADAPELPRATRLSFRGTSLSLFLYVSSLLVLSAIFVACGDGVAATPDPMPNVTPTDTRAASDGTSAQTDIPVPTATPRPTATLGPTATPRRRSTPTPMPFIGTWLTQEAVNPLTRRSTKGIWLPTAIALGLPVPPYLLIQCAEGNLQLIVVWNPSTLSPDPSPLGEYVLPVQHRIDNEAVTQLHWGLSADQASIYLLEDEIKGIIRKLYDADEFVVQIPTSSGDMTGVYDPAGLYWSVKPVLKECGQVID